MNLARVAENYKNSILNIAVVMLALIISGNIYKKQNSQIQSLREINATEIKKIAALESISRLERKIDAYKKFLPGEEAISVMNTLRDIAKESSVKIISTKPETEQKYGDYIKYPFSLSLIAPDYHALGKFISKVESSKDFYEVDTVTITSGSASGQRELNINLTINNMVYQD